MSSGREEGEIDSEEDGLRKRIDELEKENAEYEKISRISECYADKYDIVYRLNEYSDWEAVQRAGQVPTDVSSISSVEFPSPKKKRHKRNKRTKCKRLQQRSHRCSHQRHKHLKSQLHGEKRHHHRRERLLNPYYQSQRIETISLDTTDNSEYERDNYSIATMEIESADENGDSNLTLPLNREELRLALGRGASEKKNNICSIKERLQPDKYNELSRDEEQVQNFEESAPNSNDNENVVEVNSDNSISIEEQELRLIALRSAIMRKHATRKKRNAEIAYSPTDFEDLMVEPVSPVALDIEELEGDMEISPASSPNPIFSPIQCEDEQNSNISLETIENQVDNKPIDMDIASSDSEQEESTTNINNVDGFYAHQTHDIPLPPGAPMEVMGIRMSTKEYQNHAESMACDMYMPPMHFGVQAEVPPASLQMPTTTTMPPFELPEVAQNGITPEELVSSAVKNEITTEEIRMNAESSKSANMDIIAEDTQDQSEMGSDEEEAEALRALLLSQRQAGKTTRANGMLRKRKASPPAPDTPPQIAIAQPAELESIIKPQPKLLPTLQSIHCDSSIKPTPTESILKEAVRRLKVKTFARCVENNTQDTKSPVHVPRLKIKSFARCKEFEEGVAAHVQPPSVVEHQPSAFVLHPMRVNDTQNYDEQMQHEETRNSFESNLCLDAPQLQSNENNAALLLSATKRRLEKEPTMERTLRIIDLTHGVEICNSQHSTEDSNSGVLEKNKTQQNNETAAAKKQKTVTTETVQAVKVVVISLNGKERIQEVNGKERDTNTRSGEKENKAVTSAIASGKVAATNTVAKGKTNAKPLPKSAKGVTEKRKIGVITPAATKAAIAAKTTTTPIVKQLIPKAAAIAPLKLQKPQAQQLKIVKPNKVINKSVEKSEDVGAQKKLVDNSQQSRILTPTTLPNIKVNKLVIRLGASDSSSEDEVILRNETLERSIGLITARTATPDSLFGVLNENAYLGKDATVAARASPATSGILQPNDDTSNNSATKEATVGESFEKKLESFLKNIRSKTVQKISDGTVAQQPRLRKISAGIAQAGTPTAVRSLPIAYQEEYKRLVHRMKILEKQKHLKKKAKRLLEDAENYTKIKQGNANLAPKSNNVQQLQDNVKITSTATQTCNDAPCVENEKVATIIENVTQQSVCEDEHSNEPAAATTTTTSVEKLDAHAPNTKVLNKNERVLTDRLHSCEKILTSISNNIITRLDKSLQLVNEAKTAKIARMRQEQRLKELRLEMELTQRKMKEEQLKIARIYPEICANNELITKLKQKRTKVHDMAVKLGKSFKGDDYRLNNDLKNEITLKTKGLATHIKLVNSIRYCDLDVLDKEADTTTVIIDSIQKMSDIVATDNQQQQQQHETVTKPMMASAIGAEACENIESVVNALPAKEANEHEIANCTVTEHNSPAATENAVESQMNEQEVIENCDKAKVKVMPAPPAVACVEELPAPCDSGKEVLRSKEEEEESKHEEDLMTVVVVVEEQKNTTQSVLRDYVSPLEHLRSESGKWDPNDIICPYELMGQCEDKDCSYRHLDGK